MDTFARKYEKSDAKQNKKGYHLQKSSKPPNPFVDSVLFLQRTIGNHSVQKMIKSGVLQTNLKIDGAFINIHQSGSTVPQLQRQPILEDSFVGRTFLIEDENAVLRNEDLSTMKYQKSDEIPVGKKVGDTKIIPKGSEVLVMTTKLDSQKKTYAYVLQKDSNLFGFFPNIKTLGWTSVTNFKGKFENVVTATAPAKYNLGPLLGLNQTVWDPNAIIREGGPDYKSTGKKITQGTYVFVLEKSEDTDIQGKYVRVQEIVYQNNNFNLGKYLGWTSASNLTEGWSDIFGPNASWENGKFLGQVDLVNIVGTKGETEQITSSSFPYYIKMAKDAEKENINIGLVSGFRSYPTQAYLYNGYTNGTPGFNLAAKPGYSNHQNGTAFDLNTVGNGGTGTGALYNWLKDNAWKYGFVRTVPSEHWHWEYRPDNVQQGKHTTWGL